MSRCETTEHGHGDNTEMDLRMLAYFLGREGNLDQLSALAADAGPTVATVTPATQRSVIECLSGPPRSKTPRRPASRQRPSRLDR